jgi:5'-nucleotidase / UDP-sugar diphosphatase
VKKTAILLSSFVILSAASGCNMFGKKNAKSGQGSLTDVPPAAPTHQQVAYQPQYQPQYQQPVTPVNYEPAAAEPAVSTTPSASGKKYTVQKGDTLWSIAQKNYGDGKQYRKIVSANPSIKGERVLAGQTITLP